MTNSDSIARVHLQWFAENDGKGSPPAAPPAAPAAPAAPVAGKSAPAATLVETLPEDLRSYPKFAEFGTTEKLARSYQELERKIGKSIIPPGKDAKPEEWDRFYSALGRPKTAEEFALTPPEGFEANPSFMGKLKQAFHSAGATPAQASHIFNAIAEEAISSQRTASEANAQAMAAAETALHAKWGSNYDTNLARATQYVEAVGGPNAIKTLEELGVASHPLLLELFARAGEATSGKLLVKGTPPKESKSRYAYMNEGKTHPD